jgi:hypothetical protein
VAEFAGEAGNRVREYAEEAGDAAKKAAHKVEGWAEDAYDATAHAAGDFGREVTAFVKKYPIPALAVGFGLGMLLGRVSRV